ncbi:MAG: hypothetical protein JNM17_20435 [Archangium sp.]|nr:hypothetical protein [Archangium sp.]
MMMTTTDAGTDAGVPVERGPKALPLDGDGNGLWWDAPTSTLYIADDQNNRILKYRDGEGISLAANLPMAPPNGPGLGGLVLKPDGTLVVTRFGGGTYGEVVYVKTDGTGAGVVPNIPKDRRRIGLALASDGTLYDTYFVRINNVNVGSVARLDIAAGAETEVVGGMVKPVGLALTSDTMFITDQTANKLYRTPLANPSTLTTVVDVTEPDLLARGPNDSLLSGSRSNGVLQFSSSGTQSVFQGGFQQVRGVAWDEQNRRVFAVDHDGDMSNGTTHFLQIIPVP